MKYLLLPGLDGTGDLFDTFVDAAPEGALVEVASYPTDREMSYSDYAALVADAFVFDEPFVIVAESFSGPIAVLVAACRPPGLIGIVLCKSMPAKGTCLNCDLDRFPVLPIRSQCCRRDEGFESLSEIGRRHIMQPVGLLLGISEDPGIVTVSQ